MEYGVRPCAIAGFFVLVAFLWTLVLQHVVAYPLLFLFLGAVMGSAWFGGIIAGLEAVLMSAILIDFFLVPPLYSMSVAVPSQSYVAAFILFAVAISWISSARKRSEVAIRDARDQLEVKVQERTAELQQSFLEIKESAERLRLLSEAIPQQIWSADGEGRIDYCNRYLINYIGATVENLQGEAFFNIVHPMDQSMFSRAWKSAISAGRKFEMETRVRGADGEYRWFLVRSIPQHSADGKVARWYGIHIDMEQQHREQQGLVVAQDELSRLSRALSMGEMAASIAHELNQPLTAVVTHAYACREWLRTDPANIEKATVTAEKIIQESTRASSVMARVRAMFRKDAHLRELADLNSLIQDLERLLREEAIRRNISIRLILEKNLPQVELDPVQIQQVLLNLATNGMDAMMDADGLRELAIYSKMQGDNEIQVTVEDHGAGLTPEAEARMFEPFFSTKPHGTGMGLAICRSIIEAHDGRIWASKSARGGTVFHFTIRVRA
jgi:PAS domain S-box-containing protein